MKNRYIKEVKKNMYILGSNEKAYIKDLEKRIKESGIEEYDELVKQYGDPKEIAESFFDEYPARKIHKSLRIKKFVKIIMISIFIFTVAFVFLSYLEGRKSYITRQTITIEKFNE